MRAIKSLLVGLGTLSLVALIFLAAIALALLLSTLVGAGVLYAVAQISFLSVGFAWMDAFWLGIAMLIWSIWNADVDVN